MPKKRSKKAKKVSDPRIPPGWEGLVTEVMLELVERQERGEEKPPTREEFELNLRTLKEPD